MYIYKIINTVNNKFYVGKTIDIEKRWNRHKYLAKNNKMNKHLYNAMKKYGVDNFKIILIEECQDCVADERERYWIKTLNSTDMNVGYNMTFGGEGGNTWKLNNHKEETRKLLSEKLKGHNVNIEAILRNSESKRGIPLSEKQKEKISKTLKDGYKTGRIKINLPPHYDMTGYKHTEESKEKMSLYKKGKKYEEIYGKDMSDSLKNKRRECFKGKNNPNYKNIETDEIILMIKNGYTNKDVANYFNITPAMVWYRLKIIGKNATEIRKGE